MTRYEMMNAIAKTLKEGEVLHISVTNARGRTLCHDYVVTPTGYRWDGQHWNGCGNLRYAYRTRVLGRN